MNNEQRQMGDVREQALLLGHDNAGQTCRGWARGCGRWPAAYKASILVAIARRDTLRPDSCTSPSRSDRMLVCGRGSE